MNPKKGFPGGEVDQVFRYLLASKAAAASQDVDLVRSGAETIEMRVSGALKVSEVDYVGDLTRDHCAELLDTIAQGDVIEIDPALMQMIQDYLANNFGIRDRLSYHSRVLGWHFGYDEKKRAKKGLPPVGRNLYINQGRERLHAVMPFELLKLVLGHDVKSTQHTPNLEEFLEAGDVLYGELDKAAVAEKLRYLFRSKGVENMEQLEAMKIEDMREMFFSDHGFGTIMTIEVAASVFEPNLYYVPIAECKKIVGKRIWG